MPGFGTQEWLDAVAAQVAADEIADVTFTLQQVVRDTPDGDISYVVRFADGGAVASLGPADDAEVTITQDHATALELARGDLIAQAAFMQGKLKVTGDMGALLRNQNAIAAWVRATSEVETPVGKD